MMNQAFIVFLTNSLNIFAGKFFSSEYKQTIIHESPFCCINIQMIQTKSRFLSSKRTIEMSITQKVLRIHQSHHSDTSAIL